MVSFVLVNTTFFDVNREFEKHRWPSLVYQLPNSIQKIFLAITNKQKIVLKYQKGILRQQDL